MTMSGNQVSATSFFKAFQDEWENWQLDMVSGKAKAISPFEGRTDWTAAMLKEGGFFNRVMGRLDPQGLSLKYRTEWYTVDALFVGGEDLFRENHMYPSSVEVLIEHEFDENLEEEMWKLLHWRAPLKVIVAYDWSEEEKITSSRKAEWIPERIDRLKKMLLRVNEFFSENPATEYLLIIACRDKADDPIEWQTHLLSNSLVK